MIDIKSVAKGIAHMTLEHGKVNYSIRRKKTKRRRFHFDAWTPVWHEGRGPYVSIGIGPWLITRGY